MAKKRFQTLLPFALIAIVIAITLVFALRTPSARSEESNSTYEPGPYGTPMEQINEKGSWGWNFDKTPPTLPLRDLPPMPPPFGTGKRVKPDGTVEVYKPIDQLSPELRAKIEALKNRPTPWNKKVETVKEEGN